MMYASSQFQAMCCDMVIFCCDHDDVVVTQKSAKRQARKPTMHTTVKTGASKMTRHGI